MKIKRGKIKKDEDIELTTDWIQIKEEYTMWAKKQYDADINVITTKNCKKIIIETEEMVRAINKINKNKAIGIDNLTLKPLDKKETVKFKINGLDWKESQEIEKCKQGWWHRRIIERVSNSLTTYCNECI